MDADQISVHATFGKHIQLSSNLNRGSLVHVYSCTKLNLIVLYPKL